MKLDIEGGEYEILGDPRFEKVAPPVIAMEWHTTAWRTTAAHQDGYQWCRERLRTLGYKIITEVPGFSWAGNLIAVRETS